MAYKDLTLNVIETVASDLLAQNGALTTLDLKNALREDGYRATQYDVAHSMYALWQVRDWHWTFNGTYRTYYEDFASALAAYNADPNSIGQTSWFGWKSDQAMLDYAAKVAKATGSPQVAASQAPPQLARPELVLVKTDAPQKGDWVAFPYNDSSPSAFITGVTAGDFDTGDAKTNWTKARNMVRNFYADLCSVPYAEVGASVVSS